MKDQDVQSIAYLAQTFAPKAFAIDMQDNTNDEWKQRVRGEAIAFAFHAWTIGWRPTGVVSG